MKLSRQEIKYYEDNGNSIANLHLLSPSVNVVKKNKEFIDWESVQNKRFLKASMIPKKINYEFENFKEFVEKRKEMIIDRLYKVLSTK